MTNADSVILDKGTIRRELDSFSSRWRAKIDHWRETDAKHTEKSYVQQFWSDLLRCFGVIPERIELFERDASRATSGRTGYIDLFWSGVVIGEAKSLGRDLDAATEQARDYLAGGSIGQHEWPRFAIVTDFENFRLTKLGNDGWTVAFTVDEITDHIDQLIFLNGQETVTKAEEEEASIQASSLMANLYTAMLGEDADEAVGGEAPSDAGEEDWKVQKTSVFLTRVLFLLYGDDAGLWEEDLFYRFVLYDTNGDSLGAKLSQLFRVLNTPEHRRRDVPDSIAKFPYVNGGLFAEAWPSEFFTEHMRNALLAACRFHWTRISPAVFGSMFQLVKSKEARRAEGQHYTTETNILKVIRPLFLDELEEKSHRLTNNKSTSVKALQDFRDSLAEMIFLDPACGCGNFLVVAYRELRKIETKIIVALRAKEGQQTASLDVSLDQRLSIGQFYGYELNWWPAKIAETAMFLVDHQGNRTLAAAVGDAPDRLPITITAHICHGDALDMDWEYEHPQTAGPTYVFGNPPFLGHATRSEQQAGQMRKVWGSADISRLDYVTCWHAKTINFLANRAGAFGFVTTNSISQGDQVPRLFGQIFDAGWRIRFAHRTFAWNSDAPGKAAVHCIIIGFDRGKTPQPRLWDYPNAKDEAVEIKVRDQINGYLVDGPNILVEKASQPLSREVAPAYFGNMARDGGNLIIEPDQYHEVMADPVAAKYVRPFRGSRELMHNRERWCLWMVNFEPTDINHSKILKVRLEAVASFRHHSKASSTREMAGTPYLFGQRSQPDGDYLCLPKVVSEKRRYFTVQRYPADVIASDLVFHARDEDGLQFSLASSSMFITWQKTVGGRLKSDIRFASTLTWNTFPVPDLDGQTREAIIKAGQGVLKAREIYPGRSLAESYEPDAMDANLIRAHDILDRVVDSAFGLKTEEGDVRQRQEVLFLKYSQLVDQHP